LRGGTTKQSREKNFIVWTASFLAVTKALLKSYTIMDTNKKEPQVRYSDEDLEEFKALILEKLEQANASLDTLKANLSGGEHSTDDTAPTFKILEEGYAVAEKEENARLVARQEKYIHNLELALMRIENKTYGVCCETGRLIPKERLRCVPITTRCLDAKLKKK
jgi:RNA polymerase-binding transcription factor DksA